MSLGHVTAMLFYTEDVLRSVNQILNKNSGKDLSERMAEAGQNLLINAASTDMARRVASNTGCYLPYFAKVAAGNNSQQAFANVMSSSMFVEQMYYTPFYQMFCTSSYHSGRVVPRCGFSSINSYGFSPNYMGDPTLAYMC